MLPCTRFGCFSYSGSFTFPTRGCQVFVWSEICAAGRKEGTSPLRTSPLRWRRKDAPREQKEEAHAASDAAGGVSVDAGAGADTTAATQSPFGGLLGWLRGEAEGADGDASPALAPSAGEDAQPQDQGPARAQPQAVRQRRADLSA